MMHPWIEEDNQGGSQILGIMLASTRPQGSRGASIITSHLPEGEYLRQLVPSHGEEGLPYHGESLG